MQGHELHGLGGEAPEQPRKPLAAVRVPGLPRPTHRVGAERQLCSHQLTE